MANALHKAAEKYDDLDDDIEDEIEESASDATEEVAREARGEVAAGESGLGNNATGKLMGHLSQQPEEGRHVAEDALEGVNYGGAIVYGGKVAVPEFYKYLEYGTGLKGRENSSYDWVDSKEFKAPEPMPPFSKILGWVTEKPVLPREYNTQYGLAKAIQREIALLGTMPHPFLRPAAHEGFNTAAADLESDIAVLLRRYARGDV